MTTYREIVGKKLKKLHPILQQEKMDRCGITLQLEILED